VRKNFIVIKKYLVGFLLIIYAVDLSYLRRLQIIDLGYISGRELYEVALLGLLLLAIYNINKTLTVIRDTKNLPLILLYISTCTIVGYLYTKFNNISLPFSVEWRITVQGLAFISSVAAATILSQYILNSPRFVINCLYAGLVLILSTVVVQFLVQGFSGVVAHRLYGLAGEPKGLGLYLAPFVVALMFDKLSSFRGFLLLGLLTLMGFTFSATAFVTILSSVFFMMIVHDYTLRVKSIVWVSSVILALFALFAANETLYAQIAERISFRVLGADEYKGDNLTAVDFPILGWTLVEGNEGPVMNFILENPIFGFTGIGYGMQTIFAFPYLLQSGGSGFLTTAYEGYITPNLGILNNITNYGFLVLVLMLYMTIKHLNNIKRYTKNRELYFLINFFMAGFFCSFFVYELHFKTIFYFFTLMIIAKELRRRRGNFLR